MENNSRQLTQGLEAIRKKAEKSGSIRVQDILEAFPGTELSREQIAAVYAYLDREGIRLEDYQPHNVNSLNLGEEPAEEELTEEEKKVYDFYLEELESVPPLSLREESALKEKLLSGSSAEKKKAGERLTEGNLMWVVHLAAEYAGKGVPLSDLIQEGNMALFLGVSEYSGEGELSDFLEKRIRIGFKEALKLQSGYERGEENLVVLANRILEATREIEEETGQAVSPEELSRQLGVPAARISEVLRESALAIRNAER